MVPPFLGVKAAGVVEVAVVEVVLGAAVVDAGTDVEVAGFEVVAAVL